MNIITKHGLVSIVRGLDEGEWKWAVRSSNIEAINSFKTKRVISTPDNDYKFRVYLTKPELDDFVAQQLESITYSNFKDAIKDDTVHKLVYETWLSRVRLYG